MHYFPSLANQTQPTPVWITFQYVTLPSVPGLACEIFSYSDGNELTNSIQRWQWKVEQAVVAKSTQTYVL